MKQDCSNIIQAAFEGFLIVNGQGKIIETNEEYCRMSGYTRDELLRLPINSVEGTMDDEEIVRRIELIKKHGRASFESEHRRKDGTLYPVEVRVMTSDVDRFSMVSFLKDITEQKKLVADLSKAKEEAETTYREKTNFLLNLDAEFRKPLSDIISCADTLVEAIQTPELKENVQMIASTGVKLRNKLDTILEQELPNMKSGVTETPQQNS
jgi:PAS domain S-box-containing protein